MFKIIAVTNRHLCKGSLTHQIERMVKIQKPDRLILREKDLPEGDYEKLAKEVMSLCSLYEIDCILHTYIQAAIRLKSTKVHMSVYGMKGNGEYLHHFSEIGVSVHSIEEAIWAQANGATYITAGHIFATDCKKGVLPRGITFLEEVCNQVSIPVYAIGGIDKENLSFVQAAGAGGACIMSGFMKM